MFYNPDGTWPLLTLARKYMSKMAFGEKIHPSIQPPLELEGVEPIPAPSGDGGIALDESPVHHRADKYNLLRLFKQKLCKKASEILNDFLARSFAQAVGATVTVERRRYLR